MVLGRGWHADRLDTPLATARCTLALAAAVLVLVLPARSPAQSGVGRITGVVSDTAGRLLPNVSVTVAGSRRSAITDPSGRYVISLVPAGTHTVRLQHIGHRATEVSGVVVTAGGTTDVGASLVPAAVQVGGVVVSASRHLETVIDAPASVTRLEGERLAWAMGNSFAPALRDVKGLDFIQLGVTGVAINARGFNSTHGNRILMMEDGRLGVLPESGRPVWGLTSIPKLDLAAVEVMLGPGSALYGPDASNGVLTIQTKDPRQHQGTSAELTGGTRGFRDVQFRHAGVAREGTLGFKLSGEYLTADDFRNDLRYAGNVWERGIGGPVDFTTDVARAEGALVYYRGERRLELSLGASRSNGVVPTVAGRDQVVDWDYRHAQLKWNSPRWYATAYATQSRSGDSFALNRFSAARALTPVTISDDSVARLSDWPADGRLVAGEVQNNFTLARAGGTRLVWGVQFRRDLVSSSREWLSDRVTGRDIEVQQVGGYAQTETPLGNAVRLVLAARVDKHDRYERQLSPKVALTFTPWADQTFRLTANRAFKSPTLPNTDFFAPDLVRLATGAGGVGVFGNAKGFTVQDSGGRTLATYAPLGPELSTTFEVGYKGMLRDRLFVDAALYRSTYDNFISPLVRINAHETGQFAHDAAGRRVTSPNGAQSVMTYLNLGEAAVHGFDAGVKWALSSRLAASGSLSLTSLARVGRTAGDPVEVEEATALNTTPAKWTLGVDYAAANRLLGGGLLLRHVTGYTFRSGINTGTIPTFQTLDLTLVRSVPAIGAQVQLTVQNLAACSGGEHRLLLDEASPGTLFRRRSCGIGQRHIEMLNMPSVGTMLFVGIRYGL